MGGGAVVSDSMSNLQGLMGLSDRSGVDVRPTLLRVLTDLYVQKHSHTAEEEQHYTELALRLIDHVDVPMRVAVAQRLADYPEAPHAVLLRLARDIAVVATPVLEKAKSLTQSELLSIVGEFGEAHANIIAARDEFARPKPPLSRDRLAPPSPGELNDLFFTTDTDGRRLILVHLDHAPITPAAPIAEAIAAETCRKLEAAALTRNIREFAALLQDALQLADAQAKRIAHDRSGEPFLVAAKALTLPAEALQRILLFLNPSIGQSVRRVYELARLYDEMTPLSALMMLALWRDAGSARKAPHQAVHYDDDRTRSRAATQARHTPPAETHERAPRPVRRIQFRAS